MCRPTNQEDIRYLMNVLVSYHQIGGAKAGCFTHYPKHSDDPYIVKKNSFRGSVGAEKNIFRPSQGPKTMPTNSIMAQNVERYVPLISFYFLFLLFLVRSFAKNLD